MATPSPPTALLLALQVLSSGFVFKLQNETSEENQQNSVFIYSPFKGHILGGQETMIKV